jgi:hypothetical protein
MGKWKELFFWEIIGFRVCEGVLELVINEEI